MECFAHRLVNSQAYRKALAFLEQMDETEERAALSALLEALWDKALAFDALLSERQAEERWKALEKKGVLFYPVSKGPVAARWTRLFAGGISAEEKRRVGFRQYRWHIFSFGLVKAREGEAARRAFNALCLKDTAYLFFQHAGNAFCVGNAFLLRAEDLELGSAFGRSDAYLFDPKGGWTYVQTHEESCGPYFLSLP